MATFFSTPPSNKHYHNTTYMQSLPAQQRTLIQSRTSSFDGRAMNLNAGGPSSTKKQIISPPILTSDRVDRTSFSSIKETDTGIAQSFTDSKTSSYLRNEYLIRHGDLRDEAVFDDASLSSGSRTPPSDEKSGILAAKGRLTDSRLLGFVCPCDGFRGWKDINVRGRIASKSFGDLRLLGRWDWDVKDEAPQGEMMQIDGKEDIGVGKSAIESLPIELLGSIIDQLATDIPPNGFTARNIDLMSLLLTSRSMHSATLSTLYNHITIPHSRIFRKFLAHISLHPALGTIVRRLDFSHFNPTGAGQSARERAQTQNLTQATLLQCLNLTPNLREFLAQEHIDDELSTEVIQALFKLPKIKALDFCACSSPNFRDSFNAALESDLPVSLPIMRLSLHECTVLPASCFTNLLPRLPHLTILDVAHTRITDEALLSIPHTARLTHLNLSKCASLSGAAVVQFLTTHPAAKGLVYLNLAVDSKSHELLTAEDITALLPVLPETLRSLNLKGNKMDNSHIQLVLPLTKHLEELGLGRHLNLKDITKLFIPETPESDDKDVETMEIEAQLSWVPHSLRYIDVSDLNASELDLGSLFSTSCPVLQSTARPLEVLELSPEVYKKLEKSQSTLKRVGWCVKEAGRRGWLVRVKKDDEDVDSGGRGWKLGANFWGMRKIPVARAEVGGMYGHYMFKR